MAHQVLSHRAGFFQRLRNLFARPARQPQLLTSVSRDQWLARMNEEYRARTGKSLTQRQIQNLEQMQDADL